MRFSVSRGALGVCGLLLLAGCAEPESPIIPQSASPIASTRTKTSAPELDLEDPLGASDNSLANDNAAMLRSTPDYSITPSGLTSDSTLGVASGVGVDPLQPTGATLPGELPEAPEIKVDGQIGPPTIELPNTATLDP
jgi:hypothetical protein